MMRKPRTARRGRAGSDGIDGVLLTEGADGDLEVDEGDELEPHRLGLGRSRMADNSGSVGWSS